MAQSGEPIQKNREAGCSEPFGIYFHDGPQVISRALMIDGIIYP